MLLKRRFGGGGYIYRWWFGVEYAKDEFHSESTRSYKALEFSVVAVYPSTVFFVGELPQFVAPL